MPGLTVKTANESGAVRPVMSYCTLAILSTGLNAFVRNMSGPLADWLPHITASSSGASGMK